MTSKGSALVAGGTPDDMKSDQVDIKAPRGFLHNGGAVGAGAIITVPARLARELIAMGKAVVIASPGPEESSDTETEAPRRRGRLRKTEE
jgi:hypothetical protein